MSHGNNCCSINTLALSFPLIFNCLWSTAFIVICGTPALSIFADGCSFYILFNNCFEITEHEAPVSTNANVYTSPIFTDTMFSISFLLSCSSLKNVVHMSRSESETLLLRCITYSSFWSSLCKSNFCVSSSLFSFFEVFSHLFHYYLISPYFYVHIHIDLLFLLYF